MRKEDVNPAAQVQRLDRVLQAKALHGEISQTERFNVKRAWQLGKLLDEIKADCAHGEWTAKLTEMEIPQWRASECQRIAKLSAPLISTCHSIREAMKLVEEAEKGDKPTVPFAPAKPPAPEREPGLPTPEEEEQERIEADMAAEVKEKCSPAVRRAVRTNEITEEDAYAIRNESAVKQDRALDMVRLGKAKTLKAAIDKMKPRAKPEPRGEVKDALGNAVPDRVRDVFADPQLAELVNELETAEALVCAEPWLTRATKLVDHYQFVLIDKFKTHAYDALRSIQLAKEALASGLPYAVCPKCNAVENGKVCRTCRGGGHIPLHRWEELNREAV